MAYTNPLQQGRIVLIAYAPDLFSTFAVRPPNAGREIPLHGSNKILFQSDELGSSEDALFHVPFIFHQDRTTPWHEANSYLLSLAKNKSSATRPTDDMRRKAAKLLDYLKFCESNNLDWLNLQGRPASRPTYKYFSYLIHESAPKKTNKVINQYTATVYDFYEHVSKFWHSLNMDLVDSRKEVEFSIDTARGRIRIKSKKRSQTVSAPPPSLIPIGFVREDGEDLRPLTNKELGALRGIISNDSWSAQERLIINTSLMTGARKQTVLTLRMKHLKNFSEDLLRADGTFIVWAGPKTGMDTKNSKLQDLYFPKQLADELRVLANSPLAQQRRAKFKDLYAKQHPGLPPIADEDMYVFLSDQGNCYYLAKDDPRFPKVKSKPSGQVTSTIKRKLAKFSEGLLPTDFTYHWLRATFAYQLYQRIEKLDRKERLTNGDTISFIQGRLHHENREVTENYLKLFILYSKRIETQEIYEENLFRFSKYDDLIIE